MDNTEVYQVYLNNCFHLLGTTILFYDYLLTFQDEYWHIWRNPRTGASSLFFLNRYFALLSNIVMTVGNFWVFKSVEVTTQVIVGIIQLLRTYALYRRDRRVLAFMVIVAMGLAAGAVYVAIGPTPDVTLLNNGCNISSPRHTAIRYAFAWEALFIWDSLIFTLTIVKTYKERFQYTAIIGASNLLTLIVRDGAVYFAVMACAQCANSLTYYFCPPALIGILSSFSSSVSVTMTCRLMLNLQRRAPTLIGAEQTTTLSDSGYMMSTDLGFAPYNTARTNAETALSGAYYEEIELQLRMHEQKPPIESR